LGASKQENEVERVLNLLVDYDDHVDLSKITKQRLHSGIIVDFWIPSIRTVIEVHGIQHYKESGFGSKADEAKNKFVRQINRDEKLRFICKQFDIRLIEIPYTDRDVNAFAKQILELL